MPFVSILIMTMLGLSISISAPALPAPSLKQQVKPEKSKGKIILGDVREIKKVGVLSYFKRLSDEIHQDIVKLDVPFAPAFVKRHYAVFDPILARTILNDDNDTFIKGDAAKDFIKKVFAPEGILFLENDTRWAGLHQVLSQGHLNPRNFPNLYGDIFRSNFEWLINRWQKNPYKIRNLYEEITFYTMRTMAQSFFNYTLSNKELKEVVPAFKYILDFIQNRKTQVIKIPYKVPIKENKKFKKYIRCFKNLLKKIVERDPKVITINGITYKTLISQLKEFRDGQGQYLNDEEILSHMGTLFFAGHDTTANLITMLIYQLETHKDWKKSIRKEVNKTYLHRQIEWVPMGMLPFYERFQKEVLRLYPSVPVISRDTKKDAMIGNYRVKKNSTLLISPYMINRNKHYYKNPHKFIPERWDPKNELYQEISHESFASFGYGIRRCLGQWFAQAEARSFIALYLKSKITLHIETKNNTPVSMEMMCTGLPNQTLHMRLMHAFKKNEIDKNVPAIKDRRMKITNIKNVNEDKSIKTYTLASIDRRPLSYLPGDHIIVTWKNKTRHYTISSSPMSSTSTIEITIKDDPMGEMSSLIHTQWKKGTILTIRMPLYDNAQLPKDKITPVILLSGGVGITPMLSIAQYLLDNRHEGPIYFIHGSKTFSSLPAYKKLRAWANNHSNFHLIIRLSKEIRVFKGIKKGRIQKGDINNLVEKMDKKRTLGYLCGPSSMISSLSKAWQEAGFEKRRLSTFSFGGLLSSDIRRNISLDEVKEHDNDDDGWIVIDDRVLDVTDYIYAHPGNEVIRDYLGMDASRAFHSIPHSSRARQIISEDPRINLIGYLRR